MNTGAGVFVLTEANKLVALQAQAASFATENDFQVLLAKLPYWPAQVFAVELRQYEGEGLRTFAPRRAVF
jgi:hypothetical protein